MYSIGEFSRMNRITPKTLRHYDRIDLLKPVQVDSWTGYRYYSENQLPQMQQILKLKALGMPLEDIRDVLCDTSLMFSYLKKQEERLLQRFESTRTQLEVLGEYLSKEKKGEKMSINIQIKHLPEVIVASMRTIVPGYDSYFDIVPKMGDYMASVGAVCRTPAYCFTIYHDGEYRESDIDVEICEAVVSPCKESDKIKFKTIPAVTKAACIEHKGPYSCLQESYNALFSWIYKNAYTPVGLPRESYIDGIWNCEDPSEWITEIQVPVEEKDSRHETNS